MRCKNCKHRFSLSAYGDMGHSDPPGKFFAVALASLIAASLAGYFGMRGSTVSLVLAVVCVAAAIFSIGGVITGMVDLRVYDGPQCPTCKTRVARIWPWSM